MTRPDGPTVVDQKVEMSRNVYIDRPISGAFLIVAVQKPSYVEKHETSGGIDRD